jgi:hypothetical protein
MTHPEMNVEETLSGVFRTGVVYDSAMLLGLRVAESSSRLAAAYPDRGSPVFEISFWRSSLFDINVASRGELSS